MPATFTTTETFPKPPTTRQQMEEEKRLRIKAGAISCQIDEEPDQWVLITTWNVIGEDDD